MLNATPLSESAADATDRTDVDLADRLDLAEATDLSPGVLTADLRRRCEGVWLMAGTKTVCYYSAWGGRFNIQKQYLRKFCSLAAVGYLYKDRLNM